eukprot:jgi/Ulvmu1/1883/UM012_0040.1
MRPVATALCGVAQALLEPSERSDRAHGVSGNCSKSCDRGCNSFVVLLPCSVCRCTGALQHTLLLGFNSSTETGQRYAAAFSSRATHLQTATMSDLQKASQPLAPQPVDKTKIWIVLCGGAAGLFALTVLAENNKQIFPAISRANDALAAQRAQRSQATSDPVPPQEPSQGSWIDADPAAQEPPSSSEQAVLAGLQAARERAKPTGSDAAGQEAPKQDSTSKPKP